MEPRPRMLKDCLLEDSNSCSSNGFKSFPRRSPFDPFTMIPKKKQSSALQAVINAVKNLRSNAIKSAPSGILPRSLSRRLSSKNKTDNQAKIAIVRVKDIVRWNSSKDLHEDISHFDLSPPHQFTTKTMTATTGSSTTTTTTSCSSWCESDFTSEFLPSSWGGNVKKCNEKENGENNLHCVGEDSCTSVSVTDTEVGPEEDLQFENEQSSPVSVFELQHEEDDEASDSSFTRCLDNVERTKQKLMQTIQRFETLANISPFNLDEWLSMDDEESYMEGGRETDIKSDDEHCNTVDRETDDEETDEVEVKAVQLWNRVKERHATWIHEEHLIMDYFRDELMQSTNSFLETYRDQHFEDQLVGEAKGWLQGQRASELGSGSSEQRRQACAREIESRDWNEKQLKEARDEVAMEIEDGVFTLLMNEALTLLCQY